MRVSMHSAATSARCGAISSLQGMLVPLALFLRLAACKLWLQRKQSRALLKSSHAMGHQARGKLTAV